MYNLCTMKKFLLIFLLTVCIFTPRYTARADEARYSRIMTDGVTLYIDSSLTIEWFTLPVGYYVKVLSVSHYSAKVEYKSDGQSRPSAKGYISTEHLSIVDSVPTVLYPSLTLTVNQNCMIYKDTDFFITEMITQGSTVDYYGIVNRAGGESYIYGFIYTPSGDKYVGYLPRSAVNDFKDPYLEIEEPTESAEEQSFPENEPIDNGFAGNIQLVIIVAISAVAISIVYLLFRPAPSKAKDEATTENCFYDDEI